MLVSGTARAYNLVVRNDGESASKHHEYLWVVPKSDHNFDFRYLRAVSRLGVPGKTFRKLHAHNWAVGDHSHERSHSYSPIIAPEPVRRWLRFLAVFWPAMPP